MRRIGVVAAAVLLGGVGTGGAAEGGGTAPVGGRGLLRAEAEIQIHARVPGIVASIPRIEGDVVQPGEPVVILDDFDSRAELALARCDLENFEQEVKKARAPRAEDLERYQALQKEAEAAVAFAERSLQSDEELFASGVLSELNRERSRRAVDGARLALKSRELDLEILRSGARTEDVRIAEVKVERQKVVVSQKERALAATRVSGVRPGKAHVGRIGVEAGQWVESGRAVAELIYMDRVRVELDLPAEDGLRVARGTRATLRSARFPGVTLEGTVDSAAPVIDPASGTVRIVLKAANPELRMRPGVEVEVEILP